MNGTLPLPMGFANRVVFAGPYRQKPDTMLGIRLAPEIDLPAFYVVPVKDFGVPSDIAKLDEAVLAVLKELAVNDLPVYVGCMGGIGRTGMFLSLLAKTMGVKDPVKYVRKHYIPHAVETDAQHQFIADYEVPLTFWGRMALYWVAFTHGIAPKLSAAEGSKR